MRYSLLPLLSTVSATLVAAQSTANLPTCAQTAATVSIQSSGCGTTDVACICSSVLNTQALRQTIEQNCDTADQAQALSFAQTLCGSVGDTVPAIASSAADGVSTSAASDAASAAATPYSAPYSGTMSMTMQAETSAAATTDASLVDSRLAPIASSTASVATGSLNGTGSTMGAAQFMGAAVAPVANLLAAAFGLAAAIVASA